MAQFSHVDVVIDMTDLLRRAERLRNKANQGLQPDEIADFGRSLLTSPGSESVLSLIPQIASAVLQSIDSPASEHKELLIELGEMLSFSQLERTAGVISQVSDMLGEVYLLEKDLPSALLCFNRAVSMAAVSSQEPSDQASPYLHLAQTYFQMGTLKQAIRYASQAVSYSEDQLRKVGHNTFLLSRLELLYRLLSDSEDAIGKPDRARFWRQRLMRQQAVKSRKNSIDGSEPSLRLAHTGSDFQFSTDISSSESIPTGELTPNFRRSSLQVNIPVSNDPPTFRRGSLPTEAPKQVKRTESRACGLPQAALSSSQVLHQSYKQLKYTQGWSQVTISSNSDGSWLLAVKTDSGIIEKPLEKGHPWQSFGPQPLVAMLDIDEESRIVLDFTPEEAEESPKDEEIELFTEKKAYEQGEAELIYSTNSDLDRVQISAKVGNTVIRRAVLNDIRLPTISALAQYAREVLAPIVVLKAGKIDLNTDLLQAKERGNGEEAMVSITVTPATEDQGPKEYKRLYESTKNISAVEAAKRLQAWIRGFQARKLVKIMKNRSNRLIYRSFALMQGCIQEIMLVETPFGQLCALACNLSTLSTLKANVPKPIPPTPDLLPYLTHLLSPKQLLITRNQMIKGSHYQLSVYSKDGHVEIHAHKVHKTL